MNNLARPAIREQLSPRALVIIDAIEPIPEGYSEEGRPYWGGVSENFWLAILDQPERLAELLAITQADFPTFCAVFLRVVGKETVEIQPFIFNCAQHYLWNKHVIPLMRAGEALWLDVLKSRQVGISTFVCAWQFWQIWRQRDIEVLMVGNSKKLVETFVDNFRMFHDELPNIPVVKPQTRAAKSGQTRIPKHEAYFDDRRSKASIMVDKQFSTRGLHAICIQLSEAAHYEDLENVLLTLKPILPPLGSAAHKRTAIWIETTPRGQNYFYEHYNLAKSRRSSFRAVFIPYMVSEDVYSLPPPKNWRMTSEMKELQKQLTTERRKHDGKDVTRAQMYWREREMADQNWNTDMFDQEYPANDNDCFLLTTKSVFKEALKWLQQSCALTESMTPHEWAKRDVKIDPKANYVQGEMELPTPPPPFGSNASPPRFTPRFKMRSGGPLTIWSPPQRGHIYVAGIDPSGGTGNDNAVIQMLDVTEGTQAAEFADCHTGPEELADFAVALCYWYNTALALPEVNVYSSTMKRMKQVWRYPKVGKEEKWDEPAFKRNKFGYYLNNDTKRAMIAEMRFIIVNKHLRIGSRQLLAELSTFEENTSEAGNPQYGGAHGTHDDRVIGMGLALMAVKQSPRLARLLLGRNHDRVPTAADLGLTTAPAGTVPNALLGDDEMAENPWRDMEPALMRQLDTLGRPRQNDNTPYPTSPIAGNW